MIIEVYRGDALRSGPTIVEPMLADSALLGRGTSELDANAQQRSELSLAIVPRAGVRLGQLIEAIDPTTSSAYRGKVVGISINVSPGDVRMVVDIERPL